MSHYIGWEVHLRYEGQHQVVFRRIGGANYDEWGPECEQGISDCLQGRAHGKVEQYDGQCQPKRKKNCHKHLDYALEEVPR